MQKKLLITHLGLLLILLLSVLGPAEVIGVQQPIDVADGTLDDWDDARVKVYDIQGDSPVSMTDLAYVSFEFDDTWLYVRWDIFDNTSYKSGILYDMGINLTATGAAWDIFVSAEIDLVGGLPVIVNISIRDTSDNHIWNASDDGNLTEDGSLYLDPTPGLPAGNLSVEARFPLAEIGIATGVVFGSFRSHSSPSVNSAVKDEVPDSGYIILIIDSIPPQISNLDATPDPQENGGSVNITVNVVDDFNIGGVWVNISYPDGSWVNVSMPNGSIDKWYFEDVYDDLGEYSVTVWANDTQGNWNTTGPETFTIIDTDGPVIDNFDATPNPQENGGSVNITVDVVDDFEIGGVWVNITYPDGSWVNVSMPNGSIDKWYFEDDYDDLGDYTVTVWANDTQGNWETLGPDTFTIVDTDGPVIDNLDAAPNPQENGDLVNITVDVTDDIGVASVWVEIEYPGGSSLNVTMEKGAGDMWYFETHYDDLGDYTYTIWANDTQNNWNNLGPNTFTIEDTDPPEIFDPADFPDPQEMGQSVNFTVNVVDDVGVNEVWIRIGYPDGTLIDFTMEPGTGDEWFVKVPFAEPGMYTYRIEANDTSDNLNSTGWGGFLIVDLEDPEIEDPKATPNPQVENGYVNITANITDNVEIINVWINITFPNGTWINDTMNPTDTDIWYYNESFLWEGNYTYTIWVEDASGNTNSSDPKTFSIIPPETPEPSPPPPEPPEKIPKDLYIIVLLIFWPLLLILFTVLIERRYGFGNRARKELEPMIISYMKDPEKFQKIYLISQKAAIPAEEFFVASITLPKPSHIQDQFIGQIMKDIKKLNDR